MRGLLWARKASQGLPAHRRAQPRDMGVNCGRKRASRVGKEHDTGVGRTQWWKPQVQAGDSACFMVPFLV